LQLQAHFASGGLLHYGQGKWYPGEPLPRWALSCVWRADGFPLWRDPGLLAEDGHDYGHKSPDALVLVRVLAARLGLPRDYVIPAYEDVWDVLREEQNLPANYDPLERNLADPAE